MDSIIDLINKKEIWNDFLQYKSTQISVTKEEINDLREFVEKEEYLDICNRIIELDYEFSIPIKHLVNKIEKRKKRVVYTFEKNENYILKLITYLISKKYDTFYSPNCYSFRRQYTIKDAIYRLSSCTNLYKMHGYKIDVSNYFNSVDTKLLLRKVNDFFSDDVKLLKLLNEILDNNESLYNNKIVYEPKGMMAGIPISSVLANIYLMDVDDYFYNKNILYLRYSDDIIIFTEEDIFNDSCKKLIELISENGLSLNPEKIQIIKPGDYWEFLGFKFDNGMIDISNIAKQKIKGKIKRSCRKLRRWMIKKDASYERAAGAVIRKFNNKFFAKENQNELTWALWYFPVINTSEGLKEIDHYFQQELRFIKFGKHSKTNYRITYDTLKKIGYKSLVNEYYKFKEDIKRR